VTTDQGPNFGNFPKTFSMSDDLGIPKKFSYVSKFSTTFFAFPKNFFSYLPELVQPIRCAYTDHVTKSKLLRKTYLSTSAGKAFYTPLRFLS